MVVVMAPEATEQDVDAIVDRCGRPAATRSSAGA